MKLTKKAAALLLAASLAVSVCAMPVFAEDGGGATTPEPPKMGSQEVNGKLVGTSLSGSGDTKVLYKVTEHYTWSLPTTIDFGVDAGPQSKTRIVEANLGTGNGTVAGATNGTAPKVMVTENVIGVGKELQITVDTKNHSIATFDQTGGFYVEASGTSGTVEKLYFTITKPAATTGGTAAELTKADNVVLSVASGTNIADQELVFTLTTTSKTAEMAGDYEGHVVFFSELV